MDYGYCGPLFCNSFGDTLADSNATTITILSYFLLSVTDQNPQRTLHQRLFLMQGEEQAAIFFYDRQPVSYGRLYWKEEGLYREALDVRFTPARQEEVFSILATIQRQ